MDDDFDSKIPLNALEPLLRIGSEIGFDPTSSKEAEDFFLELIAGLAGQEEEIENWLRHRLVNAFKCVRQMPVWIQNPSWPFTNSGPMLFIGQTDVPKGVFHDEASFYIFYEPRTGVIKTILQVV